MNTYVYEARKTQTELERLVFQLDGLVSTSPDDAAMALKDSAHKVLVSIRTDIIQIEEMERESFFVGNPVHDDRMRRLIQDVETIKVNLEFEINPRVETIMQSLLAKAKEQNEKPSDEGWYARAQESVAKAIDFVGTPLAKLAALTGALETIVKFLGQYVR